MSEWTGGIYTFLLPPVTCGELAFTSEREVWYIIMPVAGLMTFFAKSIVRGKLGRAFVAIRDNDIAANAMGINVFTYKVSAFAICSFYAGVAGSLWAIRNLAIHVDNFTLENSIWYLGIIIVGGIGRIFGVIIGTVFLQWLKEGMAILAPVVYEFWPTIGGQFYAAAVSIFFALVLIVFLIYEPRGLAHRWEILKRTYRLWPFRY
jgi:branched-chain amino acid transport system permease protein